MTQIGIYFATNRAHEGADRWRPQRYGSGFSTDGVENLRFGWLELDVPQSAIDTCLATDTPVGRGDGNALAAVITKLAPRASIEAYEETIDPNRSERVQGKAKLGSKAMFRDLQKDMLRRCDVVVYVHGFNVTWEEAVGSALALQVMLNRDAVGDPRQQAMVVLFTWPSDGLALPFVSYKSDRTEAKASGYALARGLLKMRDHLATLADRAAGKACPQDFHLLCHSMGNYVLQNALDRMRAFTPGPLPRLFEQVLMCSPDVNAEVLEPGAPMGDLHELARSVTVYHNSGDVALHVSDYTKGNPERLGTDGAARAGLLPDKVQQVDCSGIVGGLVEHSYYLDGRVNDDIVLSLDGVAVDANTRTRVRKVAPGLQWRLA